LILKRRLKFRFHRNLLKWKSSGLIPPRGEISNALGLQTLKPSGCDELGPLGYDSALTGEWLLPFEGLCFRGQQHVHLACQEPLTQKERHIPEDLSAHKQCCENVKFHAAYPRPSFSTRPVHVWIVADRWVLGQFFLQVHYFSPVSIISPVLHTHWLIDSSIHPFIHSFIHSFVHSSSHLLLMLRNLKRSASNNTLIKCLSASLLPRPGSGLDCPELCCHNLIILSMSYF
jgi:hypothetical protein